MARTVFCQKLKKEAPGLDYPPLPGELGQKIFENISKEAWDEWVKFQTMMVNEYQLNLADAKTRKRLIAQMQKHLFEGETEQVPNYKAPEV
ncbi:MAG TPA: oxidative damage protection protein [Sutterella sp.]|nr:oxidative damage protection protein [Sutterella sp.]